MYPTVWCAPIVIAPKKGTNDIHMRIHLYVSSLVWYYSSELNMSFYCCMDKFALYAEFWHVNFTNQL